MVLLRRNRGPAFAARAAALLIALSLPSLVAGRRAARRRVDLSMQPTAGTPTPVVLKDNMVPPNAAGSRTYLIAAFPDMEQVAYCHIPDNVWRPLVIGTMLGPNAVAVDSQNARLFVADANNSVIWHYSLGVRDGFLETVGSRMAAVQGYNASWIAVNSIGDLYFIGKQTPTANVATNPFDSIWRMDALDIARGDPLNPTEVYGRSNTGSPNSKVWLPSGLAVDSFYIYWGNLGNGTTHGSVVKGSRMNIGLRVQNLDMIVLNQAFDEIRGLTATGTHVFYLTPTGVHGMLKTDSGITNQALGLIATENGAVMPSMLNATSNMSSMSNATAPSGNFTSIAWDGANSLYVAATGSNGAIYTLPALNTQPHSLQKYVDAPGVQSVALYLHVQKPNSFSTCQAPAMLTLMTWLAATLMGVRHVQA